MSLELRLRALASAVAAEIKSARADLSSHTHDDRYPRTVQLSGNGSTAQWVRVAYLNGGSEFTGAHMTLVVAGQGNFGSSLRATTIVHIGQRGTGNAYSFEASQVGNAPSPWSWKVKPRADLNQYTVELWALRPAYDAGAAVTVTSAWAGVASSLMVDMQTSSDPGGTLQPAPANLSSASSLTSGTLADARLPTRLLDYAPTVTDWNAVTTDGWYKATGAANAPDASWWIGQVTAHSSAWVVQELMPFTNANFLTGNGNAFTSLRKRRVCSNGTWGAWVTIREAEGELDARYANLSHAHDASAITSGTLADARFPDTGWISIPASGTNGYTAGWSNYLGGFTNGRYKRRSGIVYVQGLVRSTNAAPSTIFQLPAGYRPLGGTLIFSVDSSGATQARLDVDTSGNVTFGKGDPSYLSLTGVEFPAEA